MHAFIHFWRLSADSLYGTRYINFTTVYIKFEPRSVTITVRFILTMFLEDLHQFLLVFGSVLCPYSRIPTLKPWQISFDILIYLPYPIRTHLKISQQFHSRFELYAYKTIKYPEYVLLAHPFLKSILVPTSQYYNHKIRI